MADAARANWLIASSAYVGQELAAEFGQLPPCFLPLATQRLYEYQLRQIGPDASVTLTLPESFRIPLRDQRRLAALNCQILLVPDGLKLGEAIVYALNMIGAGDQPLCLLHGDTLVDRLPQPGSDEIGIAARREGYSWAEVLLDGDRVTGLHTVAAGVPSESAHPVACGSFAFRHSAALIRAITRARGNFIDGVANYAAAETMRAVPVGAWHDFGHVQTYFRSRRAVTSARAFNEVRIDGQVARKSSHNDQKIRAEADWFAALPPPIRLHSARLIDAGTADGHAYYETEYEYIPTLSELFVFGTLGRPSWMQILQSCADFLDGCAEQSGPGLADDALRILTTDKTTARLRQFAAATQFDLDRPLRYGQQTMPSLSAIAAQLATRITARPGHRQRVMHGDFCFSNILYDSRVQRIRVIDPRGYLTEDANTVYGDPRYDLAKLAHSVYGFYDHIIAGRYTMPTDPDDYSIEFDLAPHHTWMAEALMDLEVDGIQAGGGEIGAITTSLFLSMLPLHADRPDRQRAFIANALRLYRWLDRSA